MTKRKKKIKNVEAVRDEVSNAIVSTDKEAYQKRLKQKANINKQRTSLMTIDQLVVQVQRLERRIQKLEKGE